jgi:hypothetical protein
MRFFKFLFFSVIVVFIQLQVLSAQSFDSFLTILEQAESTNSSIRIEFKDNDNFYVGDLISYTQNDVTVEISTGTITVSFEKIEEIRIVNPEAKEDYWFPLHSANRLFIYPTAISSEVGTGYYQNIYVLFSNVSYTPIKGLSFNLFFSNIPELTFDENVYSFGLKYSLKPIKDVHLAVSANKYGDFISESGGFTTFSTLGTYSYQNTDFTFGLGFGANEGEISEPIALFGLQTRLRERLSFVTENLILPGSESAVFSAGSRFLGKRISADLGFFFNPDEFETIVPFVSFTTTF